MRLFLIRHAKSSWKHPELSDFDRPLNKRGKKDAPFMGKWLRSQKIEPSVIISSPAKRAKATILSLAEEIGYDAEKIIFDKRIYEAWMNDLLRIIQEVESKNKEVFLIGHNPGLNMFAEFLTDTYVENIPTCGIVCIEFSKGKWHEIKEGDGKISFFEYPKKLRP